MNFIKKLLGGRPMTFMRFAFNDVITDVAVNVYKDAFGRYWLAASRWSGFRVRIDAGLEEIYLEPKRVKTLDEYKTLYDGSECAGCSDTCTGCGKPAEQA